MVPKDIHTPFSRISKYITLHGKRYFADVIKVKDLKTGMYDSGSSELAQSNYMSR